MNKTVSCNISGVIFNLEEQAYELLSNYLNKLKKQLASIEGGDEICSDIELRIAELFSQKLTKHKEVITLLDVEEVINQLGNPEDYIDEEADASKNKFSKAEEATDKQFMRDPENGMIGGVCKGVSSYFGIDLTLVRAIFIIIAFVPGFGVLLYIILWIITPEAKSHADRLRMKGKPVNVDMMIKEVEKAAEKAASKVENYSKKNLKKENFEGVIKRTNKLGRFILSLFGAGLIVGSIIGVIMFLSTSFTNIGFFTSNDGEQLISVYDFSKVVFNSGSQHFIAWLGIVGVVIIPLLIIFVLGLSLLFKLSSPWLKFIYVFNFVFWIVAISLVSVTGVQVGREFSHLGESEELIATMNSNHIFIDIPSTFSERQLLENNKMFVVNNRDLSLIDLLEDDVKSGWVELDIVPSKDSLFHIYRETQARGITPKQGLRRAANIFHEVDVNDSLIMIQPFYTYPMEDKIRDQRVRIIVEKPEEGKITWQGNRKQLVVSKRAKRYLRQD
jgi:phage shock protein PspC (stress-responsive transcriptional regulator)